MQLKIDPFFYQVEEEMVKITTPFLKKHNLNFFQFGRVFSDGSNSFLVNNAEFIRNRVKHERGVKSHIAMDQIDKQSYMFLWNDNLSDFDTDLARESNIDNGLCFVERYSDYYNLIAFGSPVGESKIVNFYLNNLGLLKRYILEFKDTAKKLIAQADEKRIILPDNLKDPNAKTLLWKKNNKIVFEHLGVNVSLSRREWECLKELSHGSTVKEIAAKFEISPRTIETYFNRIKDKVGLTSKSELLSLFHAQLSD